jgi:hypothetical protein
MTRITQNTLIPLSLAITLFGGAFWLSSMYTTVVAAQQDFSEARRYLQQIDQRLSRIEGAMSQLERK